jgi:ankyrin repeat protein
MDCTALYWASTLGEIDIVKVLLEAGADSSAKDTMVLFIYIMHVSF